MVSVDIERATLESWMQHPNHEATTTKKGYGEFKNKGKANTRTIKGEYVLTDTSRLPLEEEIDFIGQIQTDQMERAGRQYMWHNACIRYTLLITLIICILLINDMHTYL